MVSSGGFHVSIGHEVVFHFLCRRWAEVGKRDRFVTLLSLAVRPDFQVGRTVGHSIGDQAPHSSG